MSTPVPARHAKPTRRRRRWLRPTIIAVVVILAAVAGTTWWFDRATESDDAAEVENICEQVKALPTEPPTDPFALAAAGDLMTTIAARAAGSTGPLHDEGSAVVAQLDLAKRTTGTERDRARTAAIVAWGQLVLVCQQGGYLSPT